MIIPKIVSSNQNFSAFVSWQNKSGATLKDQEVYRLKRIQKVLDNKQSKHINIIGEIAPPHENDPYVKRVRFSTFPLVGDMVKIKAQAGRKDADLQEYTRHSEWFPLDGGLEWEAIQYINRQISYIRYCVNNENHNSKLIKRRK